jgi:hypothetical protein
MNQDRAWEISLTEEVGHTLSKLFTLVPIGEEQSQARKEASFEESKDEAAYTQTSKVLDKAIAHACQAPAELSVSVRLDEWFRELTVMAGITRLNCRRLTRTDVGNSARI